MTNHNKNNNGFTLIELLVVISIISLLSSILFASFSVAKAKANDAKKMVEASEVKTALETYYNDNGVMPPNYDCNGTYCPGGGGTTLAEEDTSNPSNPQTPGGQAYQQSMEALVNAGDLTSVPHSPDPNTPYYYYDYGTGSAAGALFGTSLQAASPSGTGLANSCRPFGNAFVCFEPVNPQDPNAEGLCVNLDVDGHGHGGGCAGNSSSPNESCVMGPLSNPTCYILEPDTTRIYQPCTSPPGNLCDERLTTDYCQCTNY